ncbi:interleukin-13 receptor subunit alpha-1-like isoform X1 [Sebastes fasciatus]|uniref:interleukin-13 receptor subunit alpha-1-like isoform X1 n=1 Tax=Sebastes fasciatus TaxID=394691 RepID=UPI003D9E3069
MFQSLDFFVLSCLFLTVSSQGGQILPPQNVSLQWINDLYIQLSWEPPQHSMENCMYTVILPNEAEYDVKGQTKKFYVVMKRSSRPLEIITVCETGSSEPFKVNLFYPGLVVDLECYVHATRQTHCSWHQAPDRHADLRFYYRVLRNDGSVSIYDKSDQKVQECSSYIDPDGFTGCDLEADNSDEIHILINGTLNNTHVLYTDKIEPYVRPPALNWTVTKTGGKFYINWTLPNIPVQWNTTIRYTECNDTKYKHYEKGETSAVWDVVSNCPYRMDIRTKPLYVEGRESPRSEEKYFEADTNLWLYATIIIPLMFAGLAALIFVCFRKNKDIIFPKVPEPRDFLSDISDNNNKNEPFISTYGVGPLHGAGRHVSTVAQNGQTKH